MAATVTNTSYEVKFYRGTHQGYLDGSAGANGYDLDNKTVYFDKDKHVIRMGGIAYGLSSDQETQLKAAIASVTYTKPDGTTPAKLTITPTDGTATTIDLFRVYTGDNALDVSVITNGEEKSYRIGLKVDSSTNNVIKKTENGLSLFLDLVRENGNVILKANGQTVNSFSDADYVKDSYLKDVSYITVGDNVNQLHGKTVVPGEKYLQFTWNVGTWNGNTLTDSSTTYDYIRVADFLKAYTKGNGIDIDDTTNTISAKVKEGDTYIQLTSDGIGSTAQVATMDASIQATEASVNIIMSSDPTQTGSIAKAKADLIGTSSDAASADTIYAAKKYADEVAARDVSSGNADLWARINGNASDASDGSTIYAAKNYAKQYADASINALNDDDSSVAGQVVISVNQTSGKVGSSEKQNLKDISLGLAAGDMNTGGILSADMSIARALKALDSSISSTKNMLNWVEVS